MNNLRSVHGGANSHLCIEVSAVRGYRDRDGLETCNGDPSRAEGFGVYIRNPLAYHIRDFQLPAGASPTIWGADPAKVAAAQAQALADAFSWADGLADHLGCPVVSQLHRVQVAPPAVADPDTPTPAQLAELGVLHLRAARDAFAAARAPRTLERVRLALSSALGAVRHASLAPYREERRGL